MGEDCKVFFLLIIFRNIRYITPYRMICFNSKLLSTNIKFDNGIKIQREGRKRVNLHK